MEVVDVLEYIGIVVLWVGRKNTASEQRRVTLVYMALGFLTFVLLVKVDQSWWQSLAFTSRVDLDGYNVDQWYHEGPNEVKLQSCFGYVEGTP